MTNRIFFDIDGVLIDGFHTNPERRKRWDKNIEQDLGIKYGHIEDFILRGAFPDVLRGELDFEEELDRWLSRNNYDLKAWQVINYWHEKDANVSPAFSTVVSLSKRKDIQIYTATNQTHARIAHLRDAMGWNAYFTGFYYSARLGCLKHDANYFAQIEDELKFNPHLDPPLYFDDDSRNIEISSKRGWNAVLVDGPEDVMNHPLIQKLVTI